MVFWSNKDKNSGKSTAAEYDQESVTSTNSDRITNFGMKELKNDGGEIDYQKNVGDENITEYFENQSSSSNTSNNIHKRRGFQINQPHIKKFVDSFKRADPKAQSTIDMENELTTAVSPLSVNGVTKKQELSGDNSNSDMKQNIAKRHVLMMALGTGIGTGLLVGNGKSLNQAGPAGLVIGYAIMGSCLYCIIQACGELGVCYSKLPANFNNYPSFLVDPAFGFSVAWVYCLQWLCVSPLELVTASMTIKYWTTSVNSDVFVVIFYVLIIVINLFGGRGYAEAEFFFNCCKVLMMAGFFILGICINTGGAGKDGYIGAKYWHDPGAFRGDRAIDHFKGIMAVFVTAAFAMGASEFISITAAEQANPRKSIPTAAKIMIYRILLVFLTSITLIGFLVPWNSDKLMGSGGSATKASPYVLAASLHGVRVVPHFINAVILLSVLSVANSAFYSSSRLLYCLAQQGYAPKVFDYIDREGRPAVAMICSAVFGFIAFCAASPKEDQVFTWLLAISGLSQLFTWISICVSHIRFRRAMKVQGRSLGELGFQSQVGIYGSYYAAIMMTLALIAQFWVAIAPIGEGKLDAQNFFENYLAMPILLALYFGYKVWRRDWRIFIRADKIDLTLHRQVFDEEIIKQEEEEYREKLRNGPVWKRVRAFWC